MKIETVIHESLRIGLTTELPDGVRETRVNCACVGVSDITLETRWFEGDRSPYYVGYGEGGEIYAMIPARLCYVRYSYEGGSK